MVNNPLVTVVLITYNDVVNLPTAIKSVQNQTLQNLEIIVVDDCSADNTEAVMRNIESNDHRIRYIKRKKNSGGCGAPRNDGINVARGKFIFFLDSDDEIERHALKNMYLTAERDGADFVMGKTQRYNLVTKKQRTWLPYLFKDEKINTSVSDYPELVDDSLSTNKLYRAEFINNNNLRFIDRVHYEDVIYSARVFSLAKKITIIPDVVYIWKIYDQINRKSITNQRDTEKNIKDRIFAIKQRESIYKKLKNKAVIDRHYINFLKHGAMLYLMDAADYADLHTDRVIKLLKPMVEVIPSECFDSLEAHERVIYAMLLLEDRAGLQELAYYRKYQKRLAGKFINKDDRAYWVSSTAKGPSEDRKIRNLQDVTDFHIQQTPVSVCVYLHQITLIKRNRGSIEIVGVSQDPLRKFDLNKSISANFIFGKRDNETFRHVFPAAVHITGQRIHWRVKIKDFNFSLKAGYQPWDGYIKLQQDDYTNESPVYISTEKSEEHLILRSVSPLRRIIGIGLEAYRTLNGNLAFRHTEGAGRRRVMGVYKRILRFSTRFGNLSRRARRRLIEKYAYPLARRLPLNKKLILFESQLGQMPTGSPKALYDAVIQDDRFSAYTFVWSTNLSVGLRERRTKCIKRESWRYFWVLSRASILIEDQTLPNYFVKRKGQLYIETWHGIPFKKMGLDEPKIQRSARLSRNIIERAKAWDALVTPSQYFIDTFVNAYRYPGHLLKHGTPRNDRLVGVSSKVSIKRRLDLPEDRKIVLYAPTFREASRGGDGQFELPFSLHEWREQLGKDAYLLIRTHYLNKVSIPKGFAPYCMDVSDYPELNDIYLAADCMITDYSSTMFDYATLKRPMIFYAYDYEDYTQSERGAYFDLTEGAPGPVILKEDDLYDAVKESLRQKSVSTKYKKFLKDYCGNEDGFASKRVIDYIAKRAGA